MALRIRCPRCQAVLTVGDELAGEPMHCPECQGGFTVPLPRRAVQEEAQPPRAEAAGPQCPRCRGAIPPGARICRRCCLDLATGRRLPLVRRMRYWSAARWGVAAGLVVVLGAGGAIGWHYYRLYREAQRVVAPFRPVEKTAPPTQEWSDRLLAARSSDERTQAARELSNIGAEAAPALARALAGSLERGARPSPALQRNQRAAILLLGQFGDRSVLQVLERAAAVPALRAEAQRAQLTLGDAAALPAVAGNWIAAVRRAILLQRMEELRLFAPQAPESVVIRAAQEEAGHWAGALRTAGAPALLTAVGEYWDSWGWLGQQRAEEYAVQIFELAKPDAAGRVRPAGKAYDETIESVRAARRALDEVTAAGPPLVKAAGGLILAQCTPQYRSLRERILGSLVAALPECGPAELQRVAWAIIRLSGRSFGDLSATSAPEQVTAAEIREIVDWAGRVGVANVRLPPLELPARPELVRRIVTPQRQLERDLLEQMRGGWDAARAATDRWQLARLGCTPRALKLLHPGTRDPNYPALAFAMALVAEHQATAARGTLELWQQAADQPDWIRLLARTAVLALDARQGNLAASWPKDWLTPGLVRELDSNGAAWEVLGRIVAGGGPAMLERLEKAPEGALPAGVQKRVLAATADAENRRGRFERQ